jgi:hypothetical protein
MNLGRRKLISAIIICAAAVSCGWWVVDRSKPKLKILQNGGPKAENTMSFTLTNPTTVPYYYWVVTEFKSNHIWNIDPPIYVMHWETREEIPPKQATTISVSPPARTGKWRVSAFCSRSQNAPPSLTSRVRDFLADWNFVWVADQLKIYDKSILVPGPEMPPNR